MTSKSAEGREKKNIYKEIFDHILDNLMIVDGQSGIILDANNIWEPTTGFSREEIIGSHFSKVFADEQIKSVDSLKSENMHDYIISARLLRRKSGAPLPVEVSITIINNDGKDAILTVLRNIEERTEHENTIKLMNQKLKELNSTKDKLFSIVAHDLRNQFMTLMSFSEILRAESDTLSVEERDSFIGEIETVSHTTYGLLSNLLNWAASQTDKIKVQKSVFNLPENISGVVTELGGMLRRKEIEIETDYPEDFPVYSDSEMITVILRNLLTNAIKFSFRGGLVKISLKTEGDHAVCSVTDRGKGMTSNRIKEIFETFSGSDRGTENEAGTGLGLTLCREFVEKLGGRIGGNSAPDEGTTIFFTVELPKN
ncbi:MAG: PAS domain-containing sensor histidine kinase [Ignavibacteriales bacterium]|nr:Sensor histidine kinase TmoS [Ignavibacteriaceae bacterium]MBW7873587.1 PAS domain-containing sensor histidine kinase [Ignavibacteria bacterium]MBZ0197801.1 PAS domain-containing sensor histidine kinase [Ignavibacteriaceae bacterium]MCZ2143817.1 PAS domain-containing sensor histidine kinase [Ignavibacteriales bacterium]WKZ72757.1 MAG: PAS domain-containing sensor histidine kinase [Ignavibacteriaceae bacterium]